MDKYLEFDIKAVEDLKLGKFEKDASVEDCYSYIPGSAIKGAIVWNINNKEGSVEKDYLNGNIKFLNAYPTCDEKETKPLVSCYGGYKKEIKDNSITSYKLKMLGQESDDNIVPYTKKEYYYMENGKYYTFSLLYNESLHINKKITVKDNQDSKMYRYKALKKGQTFRASVLVNTEGHKNQIKNILQEGTIYIGGSRSSGFGKCKIENIREKKLVIDKNKYEEIAKEDYLFIYFKSDTIIYNKGKNLSYIPADSFDDYFGIKGEIELDKAFVNLNMASSFNSMYKTNTVVYSAIAKGSVIGYRINDVDSINSEKLINSIKEGIGLRKSDGYGRVEILKKEELKNSIKLEEKKVDNKQKEIKYETNSISEENKDIINMINTKIKINKSKADVQKKANVFTKPYKSGSISNSQLGRVLEIFNNRDNIYNNIKEFFNHLNEKQSYSGFKSTKMKIDNLNVKNLEELILWLGKNIQNENNLMKEMAIELGIEVIKNIRSKNQEGGN